MLVELLWETTLAGSAAVLLVLALRRHLRHAFGSIVAYAAWAAVPAAMIAVSLPAATVTVAALPAVVSFPATAPLTTMASTVFFNGSTWLVAAWLLGAGVMALRQRRQQRAFRTGLGKLTLRADGLQQAESLAGLPAALGLVRPAIVVPADFDSRYSAEERALMHAHERSHIASGDLQINALVAGVRSVFWFNPLLHLAARHFRHDQELACDQRVMARHPQGRRAYGEAMFKTQLASQPLPVGCHWAVFDPVRRHPLTERIAMLKQPVPTAARWIGGGALVLSLTLGAAFVAWSAQPKRELAVAPSSHPAAVDEVKTHDPESRVAAMAPALQDDRVESAPRTAAPAPPALLPALPAPPVPDAPPLATAQPPPPPNVESAPLPPRPPVSVPPGVPPAAPPVTAPAPPPAAAPPPPPGPGSAHTPAPKYPAGALAQQTRGKVVLEIDIDVTGTPTHVQVVKSEPAGVFDQASVDAARQWRFKPKIENGKPVSGRVRVPVEFAARKPAPVPGF